MKVIYINKKWFFLSLMFLVTIFVACDDDNDLRTPDRLFRPIINDISYGGTWIRAEWQKYKDVEHFELQLSVDSFETIVVDVNVDTTFYTFEGLEYDTEYFLRIKAVGSTLESEYFANESITTLDYPTHLNSVDNVIDNKAKITWADATYDSLVIYRNDTIVISVYLSNEDNEKGEVVVTGLAPETSYIVRAYYEGNYMGKKGFTTQASPVYEGDIIDLREYDDETAYSMLSQEFFDELATQHPDGVTIILNGGTEYELTSTRVSSPFNFVTGLSLEGNAIIRVSGNFDFSEDGTADVSKFSFSNITFTDHPDKYRDYGSTYVFNFGSGGNVDTIRFESCEIRYKRGVLRIKTPARVGVISMNDCVVDSIGGYGVFNLDNGEAGADEISITNSTLTHIEGYIVRASKTNLQPRSLTIEYVTTCFAPKGGVYFFDLDNKTFEDGIVIRNCLFGKAWGDDVTVRGLRSAASFVTLSGNYKTSDLVWETDTETFEEKYPIEANDLGADIYSVFKDPDNNDYSVIDNTVKNRAGDPRWW